MVRQKGVLEAERSWGDLARVWRRLKEETFPALSRKRKRVFKRQVAA